MKDFMVYKPIDCNTRIVHKHIVIYQTFAKLYQ